MQKIILIILISISGLSLKAQNNLDSLYAVWLDETQHDSIRAMAFYDYIWEGFLDSQPDSAFVLAENLLAFGKDKRYPKAEAYAFNIQGASWRKRRDYPKALNYYSQSLEIREQIGDQRGMANSLYSIGIIYDDQNDYPKALDYFFRSSELYEQIGDQRGMANSLTYIGNIYYGQGEYPKALDYYTRCLELSEQIGYQLGMGISLGNIGNIYNAQGDYPKALDYHTRSLKQAEEIGTQFGIAATLGNIGSIFHNQGDYPKALDYFTQSLKMLEKIGDQRSIAYTLNSIGEIYQKQGDHSKALDYCQKGYAVAVSTGYLEPQKTGCQCLYDSYKALGNDNKALEYHELLNVIEDSLHTEETAKKLQQMEFAKAMLQDSIATVEKERLVEETHKEEVRQKNKTRNIIIGIAFFFLLTAGGFYSRWRYVRKSHDIISKEKDRSENLLLNILPAEIAEELKAKGKADARDYEMVSILFTDFKGFTEASAKLSAQDLVSEINTCFETFDGIMGKYKIEKIKTIGDAYMAAGGLPVPTDDSVRNTVLAALEMQEFISKRKQEQDAQGKPAFEMRVGIHTGPVVAGIVGVKKFQYDIWGDAVNTASRMESSGAVGQVNISESTYELLKNDNVFTFDSRGKIEAKGKGAIEMHFVSKH